MVRPGSARRARLSWARVRSPTTWWWKCLTPLPVGAHVVGSPSAGELVAAGGELADEVVQALVVGVLSGRDAQVGHA